VGEDQKQHLELARDIAQKFNNDFCAEDAPLHPARTDHPARRRAHHVLRDGTNKMSKSDPSDMSRINLTDDADAIMGKIKKAKTDPNPAQRGRRSGRPPRSAQSGGHLFGHVGTVGGADSG
jgi:tryptophanyl-tRNA synthetase